MPIQNVNTWKNCWINKERNIFWKLCK